MARAENRAPYVRPVEIASVVDRVVREIRRSILTGALQPGQQFSLREIAGRSCQMLREPDFARLEESVKMFGDERLSIDEIYSAHHAFHLDLLRPAATTWDLRTLEGLWHASERYIRLAFGGLDPQPEEHRRRGRAHAALLEVFRSGDPERVADAVLKHLAVNEQIAQQALGPLDSLAT